MDDKYKILIGLFILLIVVVTIISIIYICKPKNNDIGIGTDINTCLNQCNDTFQSCLSACDNIDGGSTCQSICTIDNAICGNQCYPDIYALRNATVYSLNFFSSTGQFLGNREGDSPYKLVVQESDFPIIATYCSDLSRVNCDYTFYEDGITITEPGCYIVWYYYGYYTTSEICST